MPFSRRECAKVGLLKLVLVTSQQRPYPSRRLQSLAWALWEEASLYRFCCMVCNPQITYKKSHARCWWMNHLLKVKSIVTLCRVSPFVSQGICILSAMFIVAKLCVVGRKMLEPRPTNKGGSTVHLDKKI